MGSDPDVVDEWTGVFSLTYVSESTISPAVAAEEIAGLVARSREYNAASGLTGCLLFTGSHFAQMLEGPESEVHRLMTSIQQDPRHRRIEVVETTARNARRCGDWALGYSGPSRFVQRVIKRSLEERNSEAALRDLADLLIGLQMGAEMAVNDDPRQGALAKRAALPVLDAKR